MDRRKSIESLPETIHVDFVREDYMYPEGDSLGTVQKEFEKQKGFFVGYAQA